MSDASEFGGYVLGLIAGAWVGYHIGEIHRHLREVDKRMSEFNAGDRVKVIEVGEEFFEGRVSVGDTGVIEKVDQYDGFLQDIIQYKVSIDHCPEAEFWFNPDEIESTNGESE